jgi:hypothetical protein
VPNTKGGREPKLTSGAELVARVVANRRGCADLDSPLSRVRGKTSTSLAVAQLWAQRADSRIVITDVESQRSAGNWGGTAQPYTPIFIDGPPSSGYPAGGPVWEEALRTLGLEPGDDHTR